jgi:hypothetical protein
MTTEQIKAELFAVTLVALTAVTNLIILNLINY